MRVGWRGTTSVSAAEEGMGLRCRLHFRVSFTHGEKHKRSSTQCSSRAKLGEPDCAKLEAFLLTNHTEFPIKSAAFGETLSQPAVERSQQARRARVVVDQQAAEVTARLGLF